VSRIGLIYPFIDENLIKPRVEYEKDNTIPFTFYLNYANDGTLKKCLDVPGKKLFIESIKISFHGLFNVSINILDSTGTIYFFGDLDDIIPQEVEFSVPLECADFVGFVSNANPLTTTEIWIKGRKTI